MAETTATMGKDLLRFLLQQACPDACQRYASAQAQARRIVQQAQQPLRMFDAMTPAAAALMLGVSLKQIHRYIDLELACLRYRGRLFFDGNEVRALAERRAARREAS